MFKGENLTRCSTKLIHFCKKTTTWIILQTEQTFSVSIYFFNFGRGFCGSFSMLFPKAPPSCGKNILKSFLLHCTSICMSSKNMSHIFKILFQTEDIVSLS